MNSTRRAKFDAAVHGSSVVVFHEDLFNFKVIYYQFAYCLVVIALVALSAQSFSPHPFNLSTTIVSGQTRCGMHSAVILS
jgi:uncharacterized membrane protein